MEILEVVFGNSCYMSMKKSSLQNNEILLFNLLLNVGDLSKIDENQIVIPKYLCNERNNYSFKKEVAIINKSIKEKKKIRIWTSHYDVYSYLIMLYVCKLVQKNNYELYVIYSDEYNKDYISPSMVDSDNFANLSQIEHKLSDNEMNNFANEWIKIVRDNSEMRVLENGKIKSVSINYYDNLILEKLKLLGQVKVAKLVALLMSEVYLADSLYVYLINRIIKNNKIKIVNENNNRFFDNVIDITK